MKTHVYGNEDGPSLMLLPGLGVSYEMFLPLISLLKEFFRCLPSRLIQFGQLAVQAFGGLPGTTV